MLAAMARGGLLLMLGLGVVALPQLSSGEEPTKPKQVFAKDLDDGSIQIIGLLGKPYGEIIQIRGVWEAPTKRNFKNDYPNLRITHLDGERLDHDHEVLISAMYVHRLEFDQDAKPWQPGDVYEGRVFESGAYIRNPGKVDEILGKLPAADIYGFKFYSFLYLIDRPARPLNQEPVPQTGARRAVR